MRETTVRSPTYSLLGKNSTLPDSHHPVEHPRVVGADLRLGGPLLQPLLRSALLQLAAAEQGRRDAVEGRGLVQADEGVRLEPVPADAVATVDQGHADVGVVDQRVGEGHPHGAGAHHEIVGFDSARHESTLPPYAPRVHGSPGKPAPTSPRLVDPIRQPARVGRRRPVGATALR